MLERNTFSSSKTRNEEINGTFVGMETNKQQEGAQVHLRAQTLFTRSHLQAAQQLHSPKVQVPVSVGGKLKAGYRMHICSCHICRHSAAFQAFRRTSKSGRACSRTAVCIRPLASQAQPTNELLFCFCFFCLCAAR